MQEDEVIYEASEIIEETPIIEEPNDEAVEVEIFEAFQAPTAGDSSNHALLTNREIHDAHPITAITGLREELDSIEALQTVYSDKKGNADYYEWADGLAIADVGYFVTLNNDARITICAGDDIFGVVVDGAAFVGGQDDVTRDSHYGLVATSGAVLVRCELDVVEGDYVISNSYGMATKASSNRGYKVVAIHDVNGAPHAIINLNISADQVHLMGAELQQLGSRMGAAESNIVSAINVANEAHKQASEAATSSSVSEETVKKALESILKSEENIKEFEQTVGSASATSAQAKAIAESAVVSAMSIKDEAIGRANEAWAKADEVQTEAYSLCAKIDKHSVGEYSQAYGLTLEQANSILEIGMIYVPIGHEDSRTHTEKYLYDVDGETKTYERTFTPGYLYEWNEISDSEIGIGWVTVDKNYHGTTEADADETNPINTSAMAVYFSSTEIVVGDNNNYAYWYTTSEDILDSKGEPTDKYQPYTLYLWEDTHWVAVATLKGNVSNRMVSEVYQTTNEIMMSVMNPRGGIAGFNAKLTDTEAKVGSIAAWPSDIDNKKYNMAILEEKADDSGAYMALATVRNVEGSEPQLENIGGARIVLSDDEELGSFIQLDADRINLDTKSFTVRDTNNGDKVLLSAGNNQATIGGFIVTDKSIQNGKTSYDDADNLGVYVGTDGIGLGLGMFYVNDDGYLKSKYGQIGNWLITNDGIYNDNSGLNAGNYERDSLVKTNEKSAVRFYCGNSDRVNGNFVVLDDGSLYAGAVKLGTGTLGSDQSIFLSTTDMAGVDGFFDGTATNNWRLTVGENFGVTSDGSLYAGKGVFAGELLAATGSFGDCTISGKLTFGGNTNYYINTSGSNTYNYINLPQFIVKDSQIKLGNWYVVGGCLASAENLDQTPEGIKLSPAELYAQTFDTDTSAKEDYTVKWIDVALSATRVRDNWSKLNSMMTNAVTDGKTGYVTFRPDKNSTTVHFQKFTCGTLVEVGSLTLEEYNRIIEDKELLYNIMPN